MSTIRDVAKRAGVSISTVSRVMNGYSMISEEARQSVLSAVKELDYRPSARGKALQRSKNKIILVVSTGPRQDICAGIIDAARSLGYDTLITITPPNAVGSYVKYAEEGLISGIILLNIRLMSEFSELLLAKCPIVQCNEYTNVPGADLVTIDNMGATREITEHLIKTGKRRLALIIPEYAYGYPVKFSVDREYGFKQALDQNGIEVNPEWIIRTDYHPGNMSSEQFISDLNVIIERMLTLPASKRPDGIVCTQDMTAACCVNTARKLGISVPEEL
jgi:DNA-binding LacI/PurR family transcriptional regulator